MDYFARTKLSEKHPQIYYVAHPTVSSNPNGMQNSRYFALSYAQQRPRWSEKEIFWSIFTLKTADGKYEPTTSRHTTYHFILLCAVREPSLVVFLVSTVLCYCYSGTWSQCKGMG